ncbi:plasma membrane fusion protein prm1 [Gaertneriomyces sp. JEL0708]|nr:plasma membrane fusion protein prm1 [Gaertneriomyces sp. JEL0708]
MGDGKIKDGEGTSSFGDLLGLDLVHGSPASVRLKEWNAALRQSRQGEDEDVGSPYIGIWAKLSRAYVTHSVFSAAVVVYFLLTLSRVIDYKADSIKRELEQSCRGMEVAASSLAAVPHFAAATINEAVIASVNSVTSHTARTLSAAISLLNSLIILIVGQYTNLLFCLLDSIVGAAVGVIADYAREVADFVNAQLREIERVLLASLQLLNSELNKVANALGGAANTIAQIFGGRVDIGVFEPIDFPSVKRKLNWQIPLEFVEEIENLRDKVPKLSDLQEKLMSLISSPFELLEGLIEREVSTILVLSDDFQTIPIPSSSSKVSFCGRYMDYRWVDTVVEALRHGLIIGAIIMAGLAGLSILANVVMVIWEHRMFERKVQSYSRIMRERPTSEAARASQANARDLIHAAASPARHIWTKRLGRVFSRSEVGQNRLRWFVDYVSHRPSMLCLSAGVAGLAMLWLQFLLIDVMKERTAEAISTALVVSSTKLAKAVSAELYSATEPYVTGVNGRLDLIENKANQALFGWVNTTLDAVNNSMSQFENGFSEAMDKASNVLGPLRGVLETLWRCVIGTKTASLDALARLLREKARIDFPRIDSTSLKNVDDVTVRKHLNSAKRIMLNNSASTDIGEPDAAPQPLSLSKLVRKDGTIGDIDQADYDEGLLFKSEAEKLLESYRDTLKDSILPFTILLGFGSIVLVTGVLRLMTWWLMDCVDAYRRWRSADSRRTKSTWAPRRKWGFLRRRSGFRQATTKQSISDGAVNAIANLSRMALRKAESHGELGRPSMESLPESRKADGGQPTPRPTALIEQVMRSTLMLESPLATAPSALPSATRRHVYQDMQDTSVNQSPIKRGLVGPRDRIAVVDRTLTETNVPQSTAQTVEAGLHGRNQRAAANTQPVVFNNPPSQGGHPFIAKHPLLGRRMEAATASDQWNDISSEAVRAVQYLAMRAKGTGF